MNFHEYQEAQERTSGAYDEDKNRLVVAAMGLAGESGKVLEYIKKIRFHGHDLNRSELVEELGDVLWYLSEVASAIDVDLENVASLNIVKLQNRYPNGFEEERSRNR